MLLWNFLFFLISLAILFYLGVGEDEIGLKKGRESTGNKDDLPTPIWFRGLFAISIFRQMSTRELAIQVLEILAGWASLEPRGKWCVELGRSVVASYRQEAWGASAGSSLGRHVGALRVLSANSEASQAWGRTPRISCYIFKQLNFPFMFIGNSWPPEAPAYPQEGAEQE